MDFKILAENLEQAILEYKKKLNGVLVWFETMKNNSEKGSIIDIESIHTLKESIDILEKQIYYMEDLYREIYNQPIPSRDLQFLNAQIVDLKAEMELNTKKSEYDCFNKLYSDVPEVNALLENFKIFLNTLLNDVQTLDDLSQNESLPYYLEFYSIIKKTEEDSIEMMEFMDAATTLSPYFGASLVGHALFNKNIHIHYTEPSQPITIIYDKQGYDQFGFNRYGFDKNGYTNDGFDIYGIDVEGYDIFGYAYDGFDRNDMSRFNQPRSMYDESGYHIETGFNPFGYNNKGFNINNYDPAGYDIYGYDIYGYNQNGYARDGYNLEGYDKFGYDRNGYTFDGFDRNGFNFEGFNKNGFDKYGFDKYGFDYNGFDKNGYNRQGRDKDGYDIDGYDEQGKRNPKLPSIITDGENNSKENKLEAQYYRKCIPYIYSEFEPRIRKEILSKIKPNSNNPITYKVDKNGLIIEIIDYDYDYAEKKKSAERQINKLIQDTLDEPYFAHVNYKENPELYIGKNAIHGWVTDWADERSKYYYEYKVYIGDREAGLEYVRDILIKNRKYAGYRTKFSAQSSSEELTVTDNHLAKIIETNRKSKKIHDIIISIQKKQYDIISAKRDDNYIVLGCAGSGKTMILMHRIRFMKYNDPNLDMNQIVIISPTDILGKESNELSKLLQVDQANQFTTKSFYDYLIHEYFRRHDIYYSTFIITDSEDSNIDNYYNSTNLSNLYLRIKQLIDYKDPSALNFYNEEVHNLKQKEKKFENILCVNHEELNNLYEHYKTTLQDIALFSVSDVKHIVHTNNKYIFDHRNDNRYKTFIEFLLKCGCFSKDLNKDNDFSPEPSEMFKHTRELYSLIDKNNITSLYSAKVSDQDVQITTRVIQLINQYIMDQPDEKELYKVIDEWKSYSEDSVLKYIQELQQQIEHSKKLVRKNNIINCLLSNHYITNHSEKSDFNVESAFESIYTIYDKTEEILLNKGYDDPLKFFAKYNKLVLQMSCLNKKTTCSNANDMNYLFYLLLHVFGIEVSLEPVLDIPENKAFAILKILKWIYTDTNMEKKYFFIDEFQDFSKLELTTIFELFPNSAFNLYGDVNQCINLKGISDNIKSNFLKQKWKTFIIEENYRNAKEITEHVTKCLDIKMNPIGLSGTVTHSLTMPELDIQSDDRVAIIYKDENKLSNLISGQTVNHYTDTKEIIRGKLNAIPLNYAKGLEFEIVILIKNGMNKNELYVGATRAIQNLIIIKDNENQFKIIPYEKNEEKSIMRQFPQECKKRYIQMKANSTTIGLHVLEISKTHTIYVNATIYHLYKNQIIEYYRNQEL